MFNFKRVAMLLTAVLALALVACQPETVEVPVEVTRVVTETVTEVVEGEPVEVEVTRVVEVPVEEEMVEEAPVAKDLIVCMAQEPDTLYPYGGSMLAQRAVEHAIYELDISTLGFSYQARGIEKLPSLADGDAVINDVEVSGGETVLDASGNPVALEEGVEVVNSDGETVVFDGTPVTMPQMVVDFTMQPRVWADGTPVTTSDSVYTFNVAADPDTPASKFATDRTASYEATGDLTVQWTGVPGFLDSVYFTRFWQPFPEHLWGGLSAAEMIDAEEVSRLPVGDGPFKIVEWRPGESIFLEKNENYYPR